MKKINLKRLVILVLVLCVLPVAAFARTDYSSVYYMSTGVPRRIKYVTTYLGSATGRSAQKVIFEYSNTANVTQTTRFDYSETSSWSLKLGAGVKKSWLSAQISYENMKGKTYSAGIDMPLGAFKKLTVYERKVSKINGWKTVITIQEASIWKDRWEDIQSETVFSYETYSYPEFITAISNVTR